ncbi:MAG: hypothetical protein O7D91_07590 [Planctomycetota bacterium]|nr:hypothetical protein [Planctomycetota bacterium]
MLVVCLLLACLLAEDTIRYDKLTLLDGQVITGQIEQEAGDYVMIRVIRAGGKVNFVRRVAKQHIAKREFVDLPQHREHTPPEDAVAPVEDETEAIEDKPAYLALIFNEWEIRNVEDTARRLLKLTNRLTASEVQQLNKAAEQRVGSTLAQFAAGVNLEYSRIKSGQGFFRLYFLTHFTLRETHELLSEAFRQAFDAKIACSGHRPAGEPCDRVDTISQWIQRPNDYEGQGDHALEFSKQLTRTMGMARELVRLRHTLHLNKELIIELNSQRQRLRELLAVVNQRKSQAGRRPR